MCHAQTGFFLQRNFFLARVQGLCYSNNIPITRRNYLKIPVWFCASERVKRNRPFGISFGIRWCQPGIQFLWNMVKSESKRDRCCVYDTEKGGAFLHRNGAKKIYPFLPRSCTVFLRATHQHRRISAQN